MRDPMRCPHCGYMSFGTLRVCRRCGRPLPRLAPPGVRVPTLFSIPPAAFHLGASPAAVPGAAPGPWSFVGGSPDEEEPDWSRLSLPAEILGGDGPDATAPSLRYAGYARRAMAAFVDAPLFLFLSVVAMMPAYLTAIGGGRIGGGATLRIELLGVGAALLTAVSIHLAYHVVYWGEGGQTPGKMLMGIRVVRTDGEAIGYGRAFLRWMAYCAALLPLGLGLVVSFLHPRRRGLHDLVAGTCVVRADVGPDR
jgi:uncharacterized RDD family membrane protein YckC